MFGLVTMERSIAERILRYSKPSFVCEGRDVEQIERTVAALRRWQRESAKDFMKKHRRDPLLVWYGADSTPLSTRQTYRMFLDDLKVIRRGRESREYLIQRWFLQCGQERLAVIEEPTKLRDKTASSHFEAFRKLLPLPRQAGHAAISIHAYCWDGAVFTACRRLHKQSSQRMSTAWKCLRSTMGASPCCS